MQRMMNKDEALTAMREAVAISKDDPEAGHSKANEVLCAYLRGLGHSDLTDLFDNVEAWYA